MIDLELLRSIDLFSDLDDEVLNDLMSQSNRMELLRGDVIFEEASVADALFVVESGRVFEIDADDLRRFFSENPGALVSFLGARFVE